ncbi:MAG: hypothetical protein JW709_08905 [Sedimentisphaerales bacterium]|nr:hypothetical protein [Sedimentisphaerales bacterium]
MSKLDIKNSTIFIMLLYGGLQLFCSGCEKNSEKKQTVTFEIDKEYQKGPLTVHVRVDKSKLMIADTLLLEFEASVEPDYEVKMPGVDGLLKDFGIVDWNNPGSKLDENHRVVNTYRYRLEPFLSGTFSLPAFTFEFHGVNDSNEQKHELTTEPFDIEVTSILGERRADLKIADIEGVVGVPAKSSYGWIGIFCIVGVVVGGFVCIYLIRRRPHEVVKIFKPAHEIAYERLRDLVEQDLINAGKIKEFYDRVSDILRHYIEHRFDFRAPEKTTEEFLAEIPSANVLSSPDQNRLGEFLQHCDLVKFARYSPTTDQIQKTFDLVKNFIETTKSEEKKIDMATIASDKKLESVSV